ncbi:MAG TPA: LysR family transcriptional regulator [Roseateles sp.]
MSNPCWDDQRVFLAVLEGGSLSAAARVLGMAQPTVRARLEALEQALGVTLFTRSFQGLQPTEHAKTLHAHARAMDHASRAFLRAASAPSGEVIGTVRLSVAELVGVEVLPAMLAGLRARHPSLVIELELSNASADIPQQAVDVAVRMVAPTQDVLVARKVGGIALGLFAHRDYIAQRGMPQTLADLAVHDLIGPDRSAPDLQAMAQLLPGLMPRLQVRTDSHPAQVAAARAGLGVALMHVAMGRADTRLVRVLPDFVPATLPVWLVKHRDLRQAPRIRAAFEHLADAFAAYCRG